MARFVHVPTEGEGLWINPDLVDSVTEPTGYDPGGVLYLGDGRRIASTLPVDALLRLLEDDDA